MNQARLSFSSVETPQGLFEQIMKKIHEMRLRQIFVRLAIASISACAVLSYGVYNWAMMSADVQQSSLLSWFKFIISDPDIVFTSLKDVLFGILEALPMEAMLISLVFATLSVAAIAFILAFRQERRSTALRIAI